MYKVLMTGHSKGPASTDKGQQTHSITSNHVTSYRGQVKLYHRLLLNFLALIFLTHIEGCCGETGSH